MKNQNVKSNNATPSQSQHNNPASDLMPVEKVAASWESNSIAIIEVEDGIDSTEESCAEGWPYEIAFPISGEDWQIPTNTPPGVIVQIAGIAGLNAKPDCVGNAALANLWREALCCAAQEVAASSYGYKAKTELYLDEKIVGSDLYNVCGHFRLMYNRADIWDRLSIEKVGQVAREIELPEGTLNVDPDYHRDHDCVEGSDDYIPDFLNELEVAIKAIRALHNYREQIVERARQLIAQFWAEVMDSRNSKAV